VPLLNSKLKKKNWGKMSASKIYRGEMSAIPHWQLDLPIISTWKEMSDGLYINKPTIAVNKRFLIIIQDNHKIRGASM